MGKARGSGKGGVRGRVGEAIRAYELRPDLLPNGQPSTVERGLMVSPTGEVLWSGYGTRTSIPITASDVVPGAIITHYHPGADVAGLSVGDFAIGLQAGTIRAFVDGGGWAEARVDSPLSWGQAALVRSVVQTAHDRAVANALARGWEGNQGPGYGAFLRDHRALVQAALQGLPFRVTYTWKDGRG